MKKSVMVLFIMLVSFQAQAKTWHVIQYYDFVAAIDSCSNGDTILIEAAITPFTNYWIKNKTIFLFGKSDTAKVNLWGILNISNLSVVTIKNINFMNGLQDSNSSIKIDSCNIVGLALYNQTVFSCGGCPATGNHGVSALKVECGSVTISNSTLQGEKGGTSVCDTSFCVGMGGCYTTPCWFKPQPKPGTGGYGIEAYNSQITVSSSTLIAGLSDSAAYYGKDMFLQNSAAETLSVTMSTIQKDNSSCIGPRGSCFNIYPIPTFSNTNTTITVHVGDIFSYKVEYCNLLDTTVSVVHIKGNPSGVQFIGSDSLYGNAATAGKDTITFVLRKNGRDYDTLNLKITVVAKVGVDGKPIFALPPSSLLTVFDRSNTIVNFSFFIKDKSGFTLCVYDILGRNIWSFKAKAEAPGAQSVQWNPGKLLRSGYYFAELAIQGRQSLTKFTVMK
jgi:hypothetical protein